MSQNSKIEWTNRTWNPVRGCTRVSEGCRGCFAEGIATRFSAPGQPFHGFADHARSGSKWTGKVEVVWSKLSEIISLRKPSRIFANSMSDLFHKALSLSDIAVIYGTMIAAHHLRGHILQVLTKRSDRMLEALSSDEFWHLANGQAEMLVLEHTDPLNRRSDDARATCDDYDPEHPPPGIWLGVSCEDQTTLNDRAWRLSQTPAAVRFLSCEPLLGPLDLRFATNRWGTSWDVLTGRILHSQGGPSHTGAIHQVIVGGESGPNARPALPEWFRAPRDQCADAGVPFFFKQWGEWAPSDMAAANENRVRERRYLNASGRECHGSQASAVMHRIGKKAAGNTLDGRQHLEFPA